MRLILCCLLTAIASEAGVIQGVVLEQASGFPLARTHIRLDPIAKPGDATARPLQMMVSGSGDFLFQSVPPGLYLITAERDEYFPTSYGQRRPNGQGTPVQVTPESQLFAELRMRRMGAISGRVVDQNGVGLSGISVLAYRAQLPLRLAAQAVSDDRGVYRIHGLPPGKYWTRSAARTLEDNSGVLPTFSPRSRESGSARVHTVRVDEELFAGDLQPEPGKVFQLSGKIMCDKADPPMVTVTLSSETVKRTSQAACGQAYVFEGLAPGPYEVFAVFADSSEAGFTQLVLDRDNDLGNVQLMPAAQMDTEVRRSGATTPVKISVSLTGRRQDLAELGTEREIPITRTTMLPGHWEIRAKVEPGHYVESVINLVSTGFPPPLGGRPPDAYDVFILQHSSGRLRITVSEQACIISGTVKAEGNAVPGAPVFLWPVTETARRSLGGVRQLLADTTGQFRFEGLPPGDYCLLSSFDFREVDEDAIEEAHAITVRAESSQTATIALALWRAP